MSSWAVEYKYLGKLKASIGIEDISEELAALKKKKVFKQPSELASYDFVLEEQVVRDFEQSQEKESVSRDAGAFPAYDEPSRRKTAQDKSVSTLDTSEILRSLNELKEEIKSIRSNSPFEGEEVLDALPGRKASSNPDPSLALRMRAERAAEVYLVEENDASKILAFIDFYVAVAEAAQEEPDFAHQPLLDDEIAKVFEVTVPTAAMIDVTAALRFITTKRELVDLGFEEANVVSALLLYDCEREACIDFLMRN
jgi:hypothetical protein